MARAEVIRGEVPHWAGQVADELDARTKEYHRISGRTIFLWIALLVCVSASIHLIRGKDTELLRRVGDLAYVLPYGVPLAAGWLYRDRRRRKVLEIENRAAHARLEDAGLVYHSSILSSGSESRIERARNPV